MVEFIKNGMRGYRVKIDGVYRGKVTRVEDWTVRGSHVRWEAETKNKVYKGSASTRKEAADFLSSKINGN